ncbi:unnamed protein product [Paramecium octaurelia]|uniref:Transmembrane protein n=1 Tax=Paramecium octaurelia TaxID=43137 RepID=A0A8S1W7K4_PAROT|nr:unnamed protein product [Paramecium octaurelia]
MPCFFVLLKLVLNLLVLYFLKLHLITIFGDTLAHYISLRIQNKRKKTNFRTYKAFMHQHPYNNNRSPATKIENRKHKIHQCFRLFQQSMDRMAIRLLTTLKEKAFIVQSKTYKKFDSIQSYSVSVKIFNTIWHLFADLELIYCQQMQAQLIWQFCSMLKKRCRNLREINAHVIQYLVKKEFCMSVSRSKQYKLFRTADAKIAQQHQQRVKIIRTLSWQFIQFTGLRIVLLNQRCYKLNTWLYLQEISASNILSYFYNNSGSQITNLTFVI